jgi:hypothetical protein
MKKCPELKTVPKIYTKRKNKLKSLANLAYRNRNFETEYIPFFNFQGQNFPRIHHNIKYNKNHCCCARPIFHISRDLTTVLPLEKK